MEPSMVFALGNGSLLLTEINLKPNMDKKSHDQLNVG